MLKKMMGLGAAMALVGCGGGGGDSGGNLGGNTNTPSTPQCTATQYLEANVCKNKASQSITGLNLPAMKVDEKVVLAATASSGLALVYSSKTPTICSVSGNQVTAIKAGECSIAANQAGDAKTLAAAEVVAKATVTLAFTTNSKLTQTGITTCGNETTNGLPCTADALGALYGLGQDGEVQAGQKMNYTLLTQNGADCVKDNVTGLLWEQKTDDGGLRDKDWTYTWYNTDRATNGGAAGFQDRRDVESTFTGSTCGNGLTKCNTQDYVAALNAANYCGYSDWRMPSEEDLSSIVDFGRVNPSINPIFSHTQSIRYWSASPNDYFNNGAWGVYFSNGDSHSFNGKSADYYVRAVRAGH